MKMLVLMPCDERKVFEANEIFKNMDEYTKNRTFIFPYFMQYLISSHTVENWVLAYYYTLVAAKNLYKTAQETNDDLIIIGNMPADFQFDEIFNFQDAEREEPYEDVFLEKIKEMVSEDEMLSGMINKMHTAEESQMALKNCRATGEFLSNYLKAEAKE